MSTTDTRRPPSQNTPPLFLLSLQPFPTIILDYERQNKQSIACNVFLTIELGSE